MLESDRQVAMGSYGELRGVKKISAARPLKLNCISFVVCYVAFVVKIGSPELRCDLVTRPLLGFR
jgi:hypothetical protein